MDIRQFMKEKTFLRAEV